MAPNFLDRRLAALRALEELNGWRCDTTRIPSRQPNFSEVRCYDDSPASYTSERSSVVFEELGGLVYMLGAPGHRPLVHCRPTRHQTDG
jgi:hypothetical protein